jgi:hypothetical protein
LADVKITFAVAGKTVGIIYSSLECFDSSPLLIPKRIINKISNTHSSIEISFHIEHCDNNPNNRKGTCQNGTEKSSN